MQQELEYICILRGEDGMEFNTSFTAASRERVHDLVEEYYPESTVIEVLSPADVRAREQDLYDYAELVYDDPSYDDYNY